MEGQRKKQGAAKKSIEITLKKATPEGGGGKLKVINGG